MNSEIDYRRDALSLADAIYKQKRNDELVAANPTKLQAVHRYYKTICGSNGFSIFEAQKFYTQDEVAKHGYCTFIEGVHYQCYEKFDPMTGNLRVCKNHKEKIDKDKEDVILALVKEFLSKRQLPSANKKRSFSLFGKK